MNEFDYLGLPKDHPLRHGTILAQSGIPISLCYILTTTKRHVESVNLSTARLRGQVSFRVRNAEGGYAGISVGPNPSRERWNRYSIGSGVNLDIEDRKQAELYLAEGTTPCAYG